MFDEPLNNKIDMFDEPLNKRTLYCIIIHQFNASMFAITTPIPAEDQSALLDKQPLIINYSLKFPLSTYTFRNTRQQERCQCKSKKYILL